MLKNLSHDQLHPADDNPRTDATLGDIDQLANSIAQIGLVQPIRAQANGSGDFVIIDGWRRWTAIGVAIDKKLLPADWPVPTIVDSKVDDETRQIEMLVANIVRSDLNPFEQYRGFAALAGTHGWSAKQIAESTGVGAETVKKRLNWMKFPPHVIARIEELAAAGETRLGLWDELGSMPATQIAELCADDQVPDYASVTSAVRRRRIVAEEKKARKLAEKHGFHVVDEKLLKQALKSDDPSEHVDADVAEIISGMTRPELWSEFHWEDAWPQRVETQVVTITLTEHRVDVKRLADSSLTGDDGESDDVELSEYDKAVDEVDQAWQEAMSVYSATVQAAKQQLVRDEKPAKVLTLVLEAAWEHVSRSANATQVAEMLGTKPDTLDDYFAESGANRSRAILAAMIASYTYSHVTVDVEDARPDPGNYQVVERPIRDEYESDDDFNDAVADLEAWAAESEYRRLV